MNYVKRHVPVNPGMAEHRPQPALVIGAAYPHLTARFQNAGDIVEHPFRIQRVLQHVRKHNHVIGDCRAKVFQICFVNSEPGLSSHPRGLGVQLQSLWEEAITLVNL